MTEGPDLAIPMRPLSITILGWLFVAVGITGLVRHLGSTEAFTFRAVAWLSSLIAIVSGVWLLRGRNWARWLLVAWMGFHIGLSAVHSVDRLLAHCTIFLPVFYSLFRASSGRYFARPA